MGLGKHGRDAGDGIRRGVIEDTEICIVPEPHRGLHDEACDRSGGNVAVMGVDAGETGRLVPEGERAEFEDSLVSLMGDEETRRRMGEKAVEHAALFTREKIAEKWFTVIG